MAVTLIPALPPTTGARDGQGRDWHPSVVPTVLVTNDDGIDAPGLAVLARAAARFGRVIVAVSLASSRPRHWATPVDVAAAAMGWLLRAPAGTVLNVNVTDLPSLEVTGVREAPLARFGTVDAPLAELRTGEAGRMHLSVSAPADASDVRSDATLLAAGYVTATCIVGPRVSGKTGVAEALRAGVRSPRRNRVGTATAGV
jgi:broad specificity polyphosphatase/5'/3'-nucleotidase SurE